MTEAATHESARRMAALVAVEDARMAEDILARFEPGERKSVTVLDDPGRLIDPAHMGGAATAIVSHGVMRMLAKTNGEDLISFCHDHNVVLLIRTQEFLDSTSMLELVDGVIFQDATLHRLRDILALARSGYSILPSAAVMDIVSDRLRCDTVAKLSALELSILDQVRLAKTNRAIARSLGLTEANVKTKVRAILKALKFQNRTEAAVFAARQSETIAEAIRDRGTDTLDGDGDGEGDADDGNSPPPHGTPRLTTH